MSHQIRMEIRTLYTVHMNLHLNKIVQPLFHHHPVIDPLKISTFLYIFSSRKTLSQQCARRCQLAMEGGATAEPLALLWRKRSTASAAATANVASPIPTVKLLLPFFIGKMRQAILIWIMNQHLSWTSNYKMFSKLTLYLYTKGTKVWCSRWLIPLK